MWHNVAVLGVLEEGRVGHLGHGSGQLGQARPPSTAVNELEGQRGRRPASGRQGRHD